MMPLVTLLLLALPAGALGPDPHSAAQEETPPAASTAQEQVAVRKVGEFVARMFENRMYGEAAREAERLVRTFPENPWAWLILARCHLQDGWPMRKDARAEFAADKALELGGPQPPMLVAVATAKFRQRETLEALQAIGQVVDAPFLQVDPLTQADLLVMRAQILVREHALDEDAVQRGARDLDQALRLVPGHVMARLERAELRMAAQEWEPALEDLEVALVQSPGNKQVHWKLKSCYMALKRPEDARRHLEIWKRLNRLTDSLSSTSAPDPEETLHLLRELEGLNPSDHARVLQLGFLELEAGHPDAARRILDRLRETVPRLPGLDALERRLAGETPRAGEGSGDES
jgi:tetratricopeptide (TPR) repeat protein